MILPHTTYINDRNAPWIVLINGLFADQGSWEKTLKDLSQFNILTYDGRGQGKGPDLNNTYSLDKQVSDLYNLVESLGLKDLVLLGLSNGGRVALKFSEVHPRLVSSVIACDSYGSLNLSLKMKLSSWLEAHLEGGSTHRFNIAMPWVWGETFMEKNSDLIEVYREKSKAAIDSNIVGLLKGALEGEVDLRKITARTLFIVGDEDLLTPMSLQRKMAEQVKNSFLLEVRGGHASLIEHPENVKESILPFIKESYELG